MAVTVNLMSHIDLVTPKKKVQWLLDLMNIEMCDTVEKFITPRDPSIYGLRQPAQIFCRNRIMHNIPSISLCVNIKHILLQGKT
jgi:hypothetical protein